ncbi:MAG: DMT family transporter [Rhodospirillales bacterium]|nr:DMT family transporter [Rhodospirillales bacterium]
MFAAETAIIHHIAPQVSVEQLVALRSAGGLAFVAVMSRRQGRSVMNTSQLPLQLTRGAVATAYLWVMMFTFGRLPYADATAISYSQAAYITLFSAIFLGERVGITRWMATALGMGGAMMVIRPTFAGLDSAYFIAVIGTSLNGLAFVLNKYLQRPGGDSHQTTMIYINLMPTLLYLPVASSQHLPMSAEWPWLAAIALVGPTGMYVGLIALRYAEASALGPYTLVRLVMSAAIGALVFQEQVLPMTLAGGSAILAGCALATMRFRNIEDRPAPVTSLKLLRSLSWRQTTRAFTLNTGLRRASSDHSEPIDIGDSRERL